MATPHDLSPIPLKHAGNSWINIYNKTISGNNYDKFAAIYALFIGIEMYLKSYIIYLDKNKANVKSLQKIGHTFNTIYASLASLKNVDQTLLVDIKTALESYNLLNSNISELRYPATSRQTTFERDLYEGKHKFSKVIGEIDKEIDKMDIYHWLLK